MDATNAASEAASSVSSSEDVITRHTTLYNPSGDLVVSARAAKGTTLLFRVHSVILAQHSPVFSGMLEMPAGTGGREMYDGAPLVHFPDEAEDVEELFRVFYNPG